MKESFWKVALGWGIFILVCAMFAIAERKGESITVGPTQPGADEDRMLQEQIRHEMMMMQLRGSREFGRELGQITIE